jgi:hypothetical protein
VDADLSQLDALVEQLRQVDRVGTEIAELALPDVLGEARRTAAAGASPSGEKWAPTKDGRLALPNAANVITAQVSGARNAVITLILPAPYVYHQNAKGKTLPQRQVLFRPDEGIPDPMVRSIERSAREVLARTVRGGR